MKKIILITLISLASLGAVAQLEARVEMTEEIEGVCDLQNVYALFPMFGDQVEAVCPITKEEFLKRLNELQYLKDNPKFKYKGTIGIVINCEGEVVDCKVDVKSKDAEFNKQLTELMSSLGNWEPGKLDKKEVDSYQTYFIKIKKGKVKYA
mgnify:CR=1 FL=1